MLASEEQKAVYRLRKGKDGLSSLKESATQVRQRGSILIGLIITMVVMATLGAGMVYLTSTSTFQELFANNHARAYYAAESGVNYANAEIRQALATGKDLVFNTMANNVKDKTYTMMNGVTFEITNWTAVSSLGSMQVTYDSIGTVGSGFLQAKRKITYRISPANQGSNPPGGEELPGDKKLIPDDASTFDVPKQDLDVYYSPVDMSEVDIKDNPKVDDDRALNLKADDYTMGIKWYSDLSFAQLDKIRADNEGLLSYGVQVQIKDIDIDQNNASPYSMAGISFRLDDRNDGTTTDDADNMYGISFVRLVKPGNTGASDPNWYKLYIHTNSAWNVFSVNNAGYWFVVLWKRVFAGSTPIFTPLAYRKILQTDPVCRAGTASGCAKIKYWATLMVYVEEKGNGTNEITGYLSQPPTYERSTTDVPTPILWAEKDGDPNPIKVPTPFKPISWTVIDAGTVKNSVTFTGITDPIDIIQDGSLTTLNYTGYTIGNTAQTKAREIGLHIFNISTSAQNIYYDNFFVDLSPSNPSSGGGDFVDPDPLYEGY